MLAKLHKLKEPPTKETVSNITSRVVRGGESCPLNPYSCVLQALLTEMINDLKQIFNNITKTNLLFPLINGCDKFKEHIENISNNCNDFFKTLLITSDFSDAFTNLGLQHLKNAIENASTWLEYPTPKRTLLIKLANLIVPFCTFMTPMGIVLSKSGLPIGGHSSSEALNSSLLVDEIDTIMNLGNLIKNIKAFCRYVDDCFFTLCGDFDEMVKTIIKFASGYPSIDLNFQISPRFSVYLDYKVYNMFPSNNQLITTMMRKPLHSYNYVNINSNVPREHKGCAIISTLHRILRRCNTRSDRINEIVYTRRLMDSRGYNNEFFDKKLKYFLKQISHPKEKNENYKYRIKAKIPFDSKTLMHRFICDITKRARYHFKIHKPIIIPPTKVKQFIKSKRKIISDVAIYMEKPNPVHRKTKRCPKNCKLCHKET